MKTSLFVVVLGVAFCCVAGLRIRHKRRYTDDGCPPSKYDDSREYFGLCAFSCKPGSCRAGQSCCRNACGGTQCMTLRRPSRPLCPRGVPVVNCFADPCSVTSCPRFPRATCRSNYCGGCNAVFYVRGKNVTRFCNTRFGKFRKD